MMFSRSIQYIECREILHLADGGGVRRKENTVVALIIVSKYAFRSHYRGLGVSICCNKRDLTATIPYHTTPRTA
eukprot:scaffold8374_cov175-Amphora_coffeaeformis.AAC.77